MAIQKWCVAHWSVKCWYTSTPIFDFWCVEIMSQLYNIKVYIHNITYYNITYIQFTLYIKSSYSHHKIYTSIQWHKALQGSWWLLHDSCLFYYQDISTNPILLCRFVAVSFDRVRRARKMKMRKVCEDPQRWLSIVHQLLHVTQMTSEGSSGNDATKCGGEHGG